MECTATDWMQGIGNISQAVLTLITAAATIIVAYFAYRVSQGQIRPLLSLDIENGQYYTQIKLQNSGLGPASISKVVYKLYGESQSRVQRDVLAQAADQKQRVPGFSCAAAQAASVIDMAVRNAVDGRGLPVGGNRVCLIDHAEVDQNRRTRERLAEVLEPGSNKKEGMLAGQVLKAGGDIILLRAEVKRENHHAKEWLNQLRKKVNGAVITVEYADARGWMLPQFVGLVTMPAIKSNQNASNIAGATPVAAATAAAADAAGVPAAAAGAAGVPAVAAAAAGAAAAAAVLAAGSSSNAATVSAAITTAVTAAVSAALQASPACTAAVAKTQRLQPVDATVKKQASRCPVSPPAATRSSDAVAAASSSQQHLNSSSWGGSSSSSSPGSVDAGTAALPAESAAGTAAASAEAPASSSSQPVAAPQPPHVIVSVPHPEGSDEAEEQLPDATPASASDIDR